MTNRLKPEGDATRAARPSAGSGRSRESSDRRAQGFAGLGDPLALAEQVGIVVVAQPGAEHGPPGPPAPARPLQGLELLRGQGRPAQLAGGGRLQPAAFLPAGEADQQHHQDQKRDALDGRGQRKVPW